jgi:hypothetical protein
MKYIILSFIFLVPFLANAQQKSTALSINLDLTVNCDAVEKAVNELNLNLSGFNVDRQIQILKCYRKPGFFKNSFSIEITWSGGMNRCDGVSAVGSDFYKFLQLDDNSQIKKIILEKLGFTPVQIRNYSYNYMISLCQLFLNE